MHKEDEFSILKKYGIAVAKYKIINNKEELIKAYDEIKAPVVLKVWSKKYSHKSDIGGVVLDIWNKEMLMQSYSYLRKKFGKSKILMQKQIKKGLELYIGMKKDEIFGNMIVFGLGGVYVEVFRDVSYRICPISKEDFYDMVEELKAKKILFGYRGKKVNLEAVRRIVQKL